MAASPMSAVTGSERVCFHCGPVEENMDISALSRASRFGFVLRAKLRMIAAEWLDALGLERRASANVLDLSGGNQQRALLGRALASAAPLLLLDDPTRGVDVNAKREIYAILDRIKEEGRSALFYSTENAEFLKCDRVYVMAGGSIEAEFLGSEATEERIVHASYAKPVAPSQARRSGKRTGGSMTVGAIDERHRVRGCSEDGAKQARGGPAPQLCHSDRVRRTTPAGILLIGMLVVTVCIEPAAISSTGLSLLLDASVPVAFATLAQMLFILGGDIDLGLGFAVGFVNTVGATLLVQNPLLAAVFLLAVIAGYIMMGADRRASFRSVRRGHAGRIFCLARFGPPHSRRPGW